MSSLVFVRSIFTGVRGVNRAPAVVAFKHQATTRLATWSSVRHGSNYQGKGQFHAPGFTIAGMKRHYAVLPLVFLMSGTVIGMLSFIVYSSQTRDSVSYRRSGKTNAESMDLLNPRYLKLRVINQKIVPRAELDAILKEINSAETSDVNNK